MISDQCNCDENFLIKSNKDYSYTLFCEYANEL